MRGGKDVFYSFFFLKAFLNALKISLKSDQVCILEMLKCFKTCGIIDCNQGKKLTSMIIIYCLSIYYNNKYCYNDIIIISWDLVGMKLQ